MFNSPNHCSVALALTIFIALLHSAAAQPQGAQPDKNKFPQFAAVEEVLKEAFKPTYKFSRGDLITQSQVSEAFEEIKAVGWDISRADELLKRVLSDGDFLVRQFKTPKGKRLYSQVAGTRGTLNLLDQLRSIPNGEKTIAVLVQKTNGTDKMIRDMVTTKRGQQYARDMTRFKGSQNVTKPTNKIYRVQELTVALKEVYAEDLAIFQAEQALKKKQKKKNPRSR